MNEQIERLRALLEPEAPGEWIEHTGGGRPHPPSSYVEIETRAGVKQSRSSAFIPWPWDDEGSGRTDVMRWRFVKHPPSDKELAAFAPALLSALEEAAEIIAKCKARFQEYANSHAVKMTDEGDTKAVRNLEMAEMCGGFLARYEGGK